MKQRAVLLRLHNLSSFDMDQSAEESTFDTIFRHSASESEAKSDSPTFSNANPSNETQKKETDHSLSLIGFEIGEASADTDSIGCDWAMTDEDSSDCHPIQSVTPLTANRTPSLYSFYFEDNTMDQFDDDSSSSFPNDIILDEADFCLEDLRNHPDSLWSSAPAATFERRLSPTEISLSSESTTELHRMDSS